MIVIFLSLYIITVRGRLLWLLAQGAKTHSYATVVTFIRMMSVFLTESFHDAQVTDCMTEGDWTLREERGEFGVPCLLRVLIVWRHGSLHLMLEFRTCLTKVIDLLWHIVLNYIFEMICAVRVNHMISRCWFSFSRCAGSTSYSYFPSALRCRENCLLHAHPLHISIITWPFQSPQHHWLTALYVPPLPAIRRRPFRVFRERGHGEFARNFRTLWNNDLMASPILSPFRRYLTPPLSLPETSLSFTFLSLGSTSALTHVLHHPFQT